MNNKTFVNVQWKRNSQYIHNVPQSVSEMIDVIDQPFFIKKSLKIVSRKSKEDRQYNDQKKSDMFLSVRYVEKVFSVGQIFDRMVGDDLLSETTVAKIVNPRFIVII